MALAADLLIPQYRANRALLTVRYIPDHLHLWLLLTLTAVRWWIVIRMPATAIRVAISLLGALLLFFAIQLALFTPLLQGRGALLASQIGQVAAIEGRRLRVRLEDGSAPTVEGDERILKQLRPGQCLTVDLLRGRAGVSWVEFAPRRTLGQHRLRRGHCLDMPPA